MKSLRSIFYLLALMLLPLLLLPVAAGCAGNKFEIEIKLPEKVNSTYRIVYYARDKKGGLTIESAVAVTKGEGKLTGMTRLPVCVWIYEGSQKRPSAVFYAGRGDRIRISGEDSDPRSWKIDGNKESRRLTDWRLAHRKEIMLNSSAKLNAAVEKQVRENPGDIVSVIIADTYYDSRDPGSDYSRLMSMLRGDAAGEEARMLTGRPAQESSSLKKLDERIIVQGLPTGGDTVRPSSAQRLLLLFRRGDSDADRVAVDTLRALRRSYPDSLGYRMVEMAMYADSLSWRMHLRRDTLPSTLRARVALEMADPLALSLGVSRTPWFVVADRSRSILYSGPDAASASRAWRGGKRNAGVGQSAKR